MIIEFKDPALQELYETGETKDKSYIKKLNLPLIKKYIKTINKLKAANRRSDWFFINSLNYEKLSSSKFESVRIDGCWRLLFISTEDDKLIIERIDIYEISKHYGDN